jgi:hypothetical protein
MDEAQMDEIQGDKWSLDEALRADIDRDFKEAAKQPDTIEIPRSLARDIISLLEEWTYDLDEAEIEAEATLSEEAMLAYHATAKQAGIAEVAAALNERLDLWQAVLGQSFTWPYPYMVIYERVDRVLKPDLFKLFHDPQMAAFQKAAFFLAEAESNQDPTLKQVFLDLASLMQIAAWFEPVGSRAGDSEA